MVQRQLRIDYTEAAQLFAQLERHGILGPSKGIQARDVLVAARHAEAVAAAMQSTPAADPEAMRAGVIDARLDSFVTDLVTGDHQSLLGAPTGHNQRIAYLHTVVAANQAREQLTWIAGNLHSSQPDITAALDERMATQRAEAEQNLSREIPWDKNREAVVGMLTDALVWRRHGSARAADRAREIGEEYAGRWGVLLDPDALTVEVDPDHDPGPDQDYTEAACLLERESAVREIILPTLAEPARTEVAHALDTWQGSGIDPLNPRNYILNRDARRERFTAALDAVTMCEPDRQRIDFVVDYLHDGLTDVDLLDTPVLVDPGAETRGRVPALLDAFQRGNLNPKEMAAEISVMTVEDQQAVRDVGREIAAGHEPDLGVWPEHVNRDRTGEELGLYAREAEDQRYDADQLAENELTDEELAQVGVNDEIAARIERMADHTEQLRTTMNTGKGLVDVERAHLRAVLADITAGRILGDQQLPELMWADERTKAHADHARSDTTAGLLGRDAQAGIEDLVGRANRPGGVDRRFPAVVATLRDTLTNVAAGAGDQVEQERRRFSETRTELGQLLTQAGVDQDAKTGIRQVVDARAREAGELGRTAENRRAQWKTRTEQAANSRDDTNAQRQAATAGRSAGHGRGCTTRPDRSTQSAKSTPTHAAGRRQLHDTEIGR
jgi:hypothetical protein